MTREIEIEILDQSDVVSFNILKDEKHDVNKLINDLFSIAWFVNNENKSSDSWRYSIQYMIRK